MRETERESKRERVKKKRKREGRSSNVVTMIGPNRQRPSLP